MNNLQNKIYEAVNNGIQKALIISDNQSQDVSVKFHNKEISAEFIPYEYRFINLGLPSGLLWAEYNLGAYPSDNHEDWYGDYYAWGEIETKSDYSWENYKHFDRYYDVITKYIYVQGGRFDMMRLEADDDAITMKLGNEYRMPMETDFRELIYNTVQKWVKNYNNIKGLNGMLFISNVNDNTLFFPAAGYFNNMSECVNTKLECNIWSADVTYYSNSAKYLKINSSRTNVDTAGRQFGFSIRGVKQSFKN